MSKRVIVRLEGGLIFGKGEGKVFLLTNMIEHYLFKVKENMQGGVSRKVGVF